MHTIGVMTVMALFGGTCAVAQGFHDVPLQAKNSNTTDYADGFAGGPDYWDVANLSSGETLNVRSEPGAGKQIVGTDAPVSSDKFKGQFSFFQQTDQIRP